MRSFESLAKRKMNRKGQIGALAPAIVSLVVAIIVLVLGLVIVQELRDTQTAGTEAFTSGNESLVALGTFSDFVPIIVLAVVAAIVIGLIFVGFGMTRRAR